MVSRQRRSSTAAKEVMRIMPVQRFAQVFGAVYVLVGLLGFAFTGLDGFAAPSDDKLLLFGVNPLHNIVHLAVGALWLASSRTESSARAGGLGLGRLKASPPMDLGPATRRAEGFRGDPSAPFSIEFRLRESLRRAGRLPGASAGPGEDGRGE